MTSMTGYAYEEVSSEKAIVSVEIKSVNSRFLDLSINLPPYLNPLESFFRTKITEKVVRGKVDVYIRVKELESEAGNLYLLKAVLSLQRKWNVCLQ